MSALCVITFAMKKLDCGIHPGYTGLSALPFFDEIDPSTVDVLLISQYVHHNINGIACEMKFYQIMNTVLKLPLGSCCIITIFHGEGKITTYIQRRV